MECFEIQSILLKVLIFHEIVILLYSLLKFILAVLNQTSDEYVMIGHINDL
jgi:hypothetical protein